MTEPAITPELVAKHNLTPQEYTHAVEILGRDDGKWIFESIFSALEKKTATA